ncbi:hypothetical protein BGX38DRAFT_520558 [Terfezia claveryi]|nr:hypothetical protein BGX38DRAFT_520558 [Terfezia claveryi]
MILGFTLCIVLQGSKSYFGLLSAAQSPNRCLAPRVRISWLEQHPAITVDGCACAYSTRIHGGGWPDHCHSQELLIPPRYSKFSPRRSVSVV